MKIKTFVMAAAFAVVALFTTMTVHADDIASGTSGTCDWVIDEDGVLTISPTDGESGTLGKFSSYATVPWYSYGSYIVSVEVDEGVSTSTKCAGMFYNCTNLTDISGLANLNVSSATTLDSTFGGCTSLTDLNGLADWDVSNVTTLYETFFYCTNLTNIDGLTDWDTGNVTTLFRTFYYCTSLESALLCGWNTSSVTSMSNMFYNNSSLKKIYVGDDWSTDNMTSSSYMFAGCSKLIGGNGTTFDSSTVDAIYAVIDTEDTTGYLSACVTDDTSEALGHLKITGTKVLTDLDTGENESVSDGDYTIMLYDGDGNLLDYNTVDDGGGFWFYTEVYEEGTYTYYVQEVDESDTNTDVTYDTAMYEITVTVTADSFDSVGIYEVDSGVTITNTKGTPSVTVQITAQKTLTDSSNSGKTLSDYTFSFELYDSDGEVIDTATCDSDGTITFTVEIDSAGTYTYTIKKVVGDDAHITYDDTEADVTFTIENSDGTLGLAA